MGIVERDPIIAVGENLRHGTIEFEQLFLGHIDPLLHGCMSSLYGEMQALSSRRGRLSGAMKVSVLSQSCFCLHAHCSGVSPPIVFLANSISVTAIRTWARVLRSGASNS